MLKDFFDIEEIDEAEVKEDKLHEKFSKVGCSRRKQFRQSTLDKFTGSSPKTPLSGNSSSLRRKRIPEGRGHFSVTRTGIF